MIVYHVVRGTVFFSFERFCVFSGAPECVSKVVCLCFIVKHCVVGTCTNVCVCVCVCGAADKRSSPK